MQIVVWLYLMVSFSVWVAIATRILSKDDTNKSKAINLAAGVPLSLLWVIFCTILLKNNLN